MFVEHDSILDAVVDGIKNSNYDVIIDEIDKMIEDYEVIDHILLEELGCDLIIDFMEPRDFLLTIRNIAEMYRSGKKEST